jgi:RNA polymerase sigma factor (sigma-70 family)
MIDRADDREHKPEGGLACAPGEEPGATSADAGFTSIYETYSPLVYRTCLEVLRDPYEAQDATQETFIRAYREGAALPQRPGPWLRVVARNHSLDLVRRRARVERLTSQLNAVATAAEDPSGRVVNRIALSELLEGLGPRERAVLVGSGVEDRPLDSLARSLGLSYMGTAQLLHRARRRARRLLGEAIAMLLPFLPERFRSRTGSAWTHVMQAGGRAPELAAAAAVAAVLVAGQGLVSPDGAIPKPADGPATAAQEAPGQAGTRGPALPPLAAPSAPVTTAGQAPAGDAPAVRSVLPQSGLGAAPGLPGSVGLAGAPELPPVQLPPGLPALPADAVPPTVIQPPPVQVSPPVIQPPPVQVSPPALQPPPVQVPPPVLQPPPVQVPLPLSSPPTVQGSPALPPPPPVPPITLTLPGPVTVAAVGPSGAYVNFQVSASGGQGALKLTCSRPSGSRFSIGATEVRCTATDAAGRTASGSFTVYVLALPSLPSPGTPGLPVL